MSPDTLVKPMPYRPDIDEMLEVIEQHLDFFEILVRIDYLGDRQIFSGCQQHTFAGPMPSSLSTGFSLYTKPMFWRANPDEVTTDWRAVCAKTACTVRRVGRTRVLPDPYQRCANRAPNCAAVWRSELSALFGCFYAT